MTKAEEFLWIVQTTMVCNAVNMSLESENAIKNRHVFSATGTLNVAREAVRAAQLIPQDMDAADAADQFCGYMLGNLRAAAEKDGSRLKVPAWFARG